MPPTGEPSSSTEMPWNGDSDDSDDDDDVPGLEDSERDDNLERAANDGDRAALFGAAAVEGGGDDRGDTATHEEPAALGDVGAAGAAPHAVAHTQLAALNVDRAEQREPDQVDGRRAVGEDEGGLARRDLERGIRVAV